MRAEGIRGVARDQGPRTTKPAPETGRPADLVERRLTATAANRLWVADITHTSARSPAGSMAFVLDVFSHRIVGWRVSTRLYTELALDALEMGIWVRAKNGVADLLGLTHHSDRGARYRAIKYAERLEAEDAVSSVGSRGAGYDNAMAEAHSSLFKGQSWYETRAVAGRQPPRGRRRRVG